MFNLIAPACLIILSTNLNEYVGGFSWTGESIAQLSPGNGLKKKQFPVMPTPGISKEQENINTLIPVVLPTNAKVLLKVGGLTAGQVKGFDAKQQTLTLEEESIPLAQIEKVIFDDKPLAYRSDETRVIRGEDTAKAKQSIWQNVLLSKFQLKDPKLGKAQVNLAGVIKPLELRSIQSVAKNSVYLVDEILFQPTGKMMTIKVTPSDGKAE
jgi:hypothetical protein